MSRTNIIWDDDLKLARAKDFSFKYLNRVAAEETATSIFVDGEYLVSKMGKVSRIVDCGSNIGLSIIYFKLMFPNARVDCFEPDPRGFSTLVENMKLNKLKDVHCHNFAVNEEPGRVKLFGQIDGASPDIRGNSIIAEWGNQRRNSASISVESKTLSSYIDCKVDILKLDIEGAEYRVLNEISSRLHLVKYIYIEVHETNQLAQLERIKLLLMENNFSVSITKKSCEAIWGEETLKWASENRPELYLLTAQNLAFCES